MTEEKTAAPKSPAAAPRKRRRWPWIVAGALVLMVLLVALAPAILSTGVGKAIVLSQVNKQLNGRVTIDDWSLGWFSGFRFDGIQVTDTEGASVIEVASVDVPASIPGLLGKNKKIGAVTVESPRLNIVVYPDGTNNLMALLKEKDSEDEGPVELDVWAKLALTNGEVSISTGEASEAFVMRNLNVTASVESLNQPASFEITTEFLEKNSELAVTGTVTLAKEGVIVPDEIEADVSVRLDGLELASISDVLRRFGSPVDMEGRLTLAVTAALRGADSIETNGSVDVASLALSGGPLGADTPSFEKADARFNVALNGKKLDVTEFSAHLPVADATASGTLNLSESGGLPSGNLDAVTTVHLAALTAQFPNTLKLQKGLTVESGTLSLESKVISDASGPRVESAIRIEGVEATRNGQRIGLQAPVRVALKARQTGGGIRLDTFELDASFAKARGSGDMQEFDLDVTTDLAAAVKEAAQFVDMGGMSASGTAALSVRLASLEAQRKKLRISAGVNDLLVQGIGPGPAALKEALCTVEAVAELDERNALQRFSEVSATLSSPLAEASFSADTIHPAAGQTQSLALINGRALFTSNLADLAAFATAMGVMPAAVQVSGALEARTRVAVAGGAVRAKDVDIVLKDLELVSDGKRLREPELHFTGKDVEAILEKKSFAAQEFAVALSAGQVAIPFVNIPDWSKKDATGMPSGLNAAVNGEFDVAKSLEVLKDFFQLPEGTDMSGKAAFVVAATAAQDGVTARLSGAVNNFKFTQPDKPEIRDDALKFDAVTAFRPKDDTLTFDSVAFTSTFLNLAAKGKLSDLADAKNLAATGTIEPDFERIAPLAEAFIGQPIELSGKEARPFEVNTALAGPGWRAIMRDTLASAGVSLDRVKFMGIETGPVDMPLRIADGKGQFRIETTVETGKVLLPVILDITKDVPTVAIADNTRMLTDVPITDEMADLFLAKSSPLFKGAVISDGTLGLNIAKFRASLEGDITRNAVFDGEVIFKSVRMRAGGLLLKIMEAGRFGGSSGVNIPDQNVAVSFRDGRFYQGPLAISADGYSLIISGSVGLDKTLDMIAELPVTPELLGKNKELYALLKDETIKVPVKGTADRPAIGADILQDNLMSLVKAAAKNEIKNQGLKLIEKGLGDLLGGGK